MQLFYISLNNFSYVEQYCAFVFVEKPVQLQQILVGIVFGYFTTFCNYMVSYLLTPHNLAIRIVMVLASTVFVAFGIFLYLPADLIPLAGEGCMQAVISKWRIRQKLSGNCFRRKWACDIKNGRLLPPGNPV